MPNETTQTFVDVVDATECYVVVLKFTTLIPSFRDEVVRHVRIAISEWKTKDLDGKFPDGIGAFNPGDLLDWANDPKLAARLLAEGITKVEPGTIEGSVAAWQFDEVSVP